MIKRVLSLTLFSALAASHTAVSAPSRVADAIYFGGDIVTVDDARPKAEALAVKDGKILAVGPLQEVTARAKGEATRLVDLKGKALLPGFIDPHSHFINGLAMEDQANVTAPPVGDASNAADIVRNLKAFAARKGKKPGELIIGYGYDDNMLPPDHPLTRDDLDPAFPDNPVIVIHVSTHGAVLNSAALKQFNITAATPTPAGGVIARKPGSDEPTGLLMETAWLPLHEQLPAPTRDQEAEQIKYAQALYARAGVTTAQEGASMAPHVELLQRAARAGGLYIDLISYPFVGDLEAVLRNNPPERFGAYENRFKLGGCKILADGSPQGRTAAFTTPYLTGGPGGEKDWRGELTFPQETLNAMFRACYDRGLQVTAHANGDAGIDAVLRAHEAAAPDSLDRDRRTVVIHSQFVRKDQLEKFVAYRMNPSFFTEHTFFFGDAHLKNRGLAQASFISPMRAAIDLGLRPTNHTDFSVVPMDQMMVMWTAVNRPMRNGETLGPDQRVTPLEALKAITINAARQYFEDDRKGSLTPGKQADLVILDRNPLTVPPQQIKDIRVLETIKDGHTVYAAQ